MISSMKDSALFRSGLVWLIAGLGVTLYASIGILFEDIPGIELLVTWLQSLVGWWLIVAVLVAIFIEGLYFVGSFFPGTSVVLLLAVLSQTDSLLLFTATMLSIFVGWCIAGIVNVLVARRFTTDTTVDRNTTEYASVTWMPSLRANQEVAQVIAGASAGRVWLSSVRIKLVTCLIITVLMWLFAHLIDVTEISNDEGFATLFVSAFIMSIVVMRQIQQSYKASPVTQRDT